MSNSIHLGGMSNYYNSIIQSTQKQRSSGTKMAENQTVATETKKDFLETVREKAGVFSTTEVSKPISTKDMTLDEYKSYIANKISQVPVHPSRALESVSIHITDEGFKAMQNDPEYEAWVMDCFEHNFGLNDPMISVCGGYYCVYHIGATKEECSATGWHADKGGKNKDIWEEESEGAFWTRRAERKEMQERLDKKAFERRLEQHELLEEYIGEQIRNRKEMNQYFNAMHYKNGLATVGMENIAFEHSGTSEYDASAAYEVNFMMSGIMSNL